MAGITLQCFTPCKALSSNQLGNSLAINIAEIQTAPSNSRFRDLHISRF